MHASTPTARLATGWFAAATFLVLGMALRAPLSLTVLGLACLGVAHVVLELRYVLGRFADALDARFALLTVLLLTGIALSRILATGLPRPGLIAEIVAGWGLLAVAAWWGLRGWPRWVVLVLIGLGSVLSLRHAAVHLFLLTHLHNLVPLLFLWDYARRWPRGRWRRGFLAVNVAWVLLVPVIVGLGVVDPWLRLGGDLAHGLVGDGTSVVKASAPPGADAVLALRWLAIFAFGQTMHYATWIGFLPWAAPRENARFERLVPALRGGRIWIVVAVATLALMTVFGWHYAVGKQVYSVIASYHVYLEFPILLLVLLGARSFGLPRPGVVSD